MFAAFAALDAVEGRGADGPPASRPISTPDEQSPPGEVLFADETPVFALPDPQPVPPAEVVLEDTEGVAAGIAEVFDTEPPHWANELINDHALIYRETRNETEVLGRGSVFGMTSLGFGSSVAGSKNGPFWFNPKFGWHFLSGPGQPDVRPQFYDLSVEINFAHRLDDVWSLHLQATPTWATDFDNKGSEAFRMIGGGLIAARLSPMWSVVGGATYLDRSDLPWLPIGGVRLATEDVELDLLVPRPRFAWRTSAESKSENWVYLSGEVGGGAWAFEREDTGLHDVFNYRDLRLLFGFETRQTDGSRQVFEAGYVFDRNIEFDVGPGKLTPGDTWLLRWGSTY